MRSLHRVALCLALMGCETTATPDVGDPADAGSAADARARNDAASGIDAMQPADATLTDLGGALDASTAHDAGVLDATTPPDGSAPPDAETPIDVGASPVGGAYFPASAWMYQDISTEPLAPGSAVTTQWLADNGGFGTGQMRIDFSIEVLDANGAAPQPFTPTSDFYEPDCDRVRIPLPPGGNLEGETGYECVSDGDCHLIVVDRPAQRLYEMWRANVVGGTFRGGCAVLWDMARVYPGAGRGEQCTSADAAGFPIAPLLFTADEIAAGSIHHAIRFILPNARMRADYYVRPATHAGGPSGPSTAPVYGSRWRLRADFPLASLPNDAARVVARALQAYGMALADGGNIALTAQSDTHTTAKWAEVGLETRDLAALQPTDFEIVDTGPPIELTFDCARAPINEF
ncbi:MAG: hypothetical protein HYV07_19205 [Deltaproteobacteria bacterium]|nr:hypothetical protein [Deltaproteobacteria bacterium]